MAKKTIITCDVTGKEGAETITLPVFFVREPNQAGRVEFIPTRFEVDLSPEAQQMLITHLMMRIPEKDHVEVVRSFFQLHTRRDLSKAITKRLEAL